MRNKKSSGGGKESPGLIAAAIAKSTGDIMNNWIEWEGGDCPVPANTAVDIRFRDGDESSRRSGDKLRWSHIDSLRDIVAYRVVKEADATTQKTTTDVAQVLTERGERYGRFTGHAVISQKLKHVIFEHAGENARGISPDQLEALEMICHKMARILNGDPNYADSWVDIAGYAKLVADRLQGVER